MKGKILFPKKEVKKLTLDELENFVQALNCFMGEKTRLDECLCSISGSNVLADIGGDMISKYAEMIDRLSGKEITTNNDFLTFYFTEYDGDNLNKYLNE